MTNREPGLLTVPTERLEQLLRAIHRRETTVPVTPASLTALGLQDWSEALLGQLRGLEERAVRVVLVCVLSERKFAD